MKVSEEEMKATVSAIQEMIEGSQKKIEGVIRNGHEEIKTAINSIQSELEKTIRHRVEDVLVSVDQQTRGLCKKLNEKIEQTQSGLQTAMSLDHRSQVEAQTRTLVETTWHELEAKIAKVTDDYTQGLDLMRREFETQLKEVEARAARRVSANIGTDAGRVETPKFDESTSWAVLCLQFEAVARHYKWAHCVKATRLVAALQGEASDVLHGVPERAMYEETVEALEDRFGYHHMAAAYHSQLKARTQDDGESPQESATAVRQMTQ
jgi:BMFP domain-containing protein YqiC